MDNRQMAIQNFRNSAGQRFNNFDGGGNGSLLANKSGMAQKAPGFNASGNPQAAGIAPQYILQISNSSAAAQANFDIFGAAIYLNGSFNGATWSNSGNLTIGTVTISSVLPNVTYQQILASSAAKPFKVGGVYLQSIAGSTAQVTDVYQLTSQTAAGELYQMPIAPILDGYQFNAGITYNTTSFNVETMTKLTWSQIYGSAVFQIRIFPATIIDQSNALNNAQVHNTYQQGRVIGRLN